MRIATHPEAIKHLVKIGMASDISEHIKMVESANESLIKEKDELRAVAEDNKRECEATRIENARLKADAERYRLASLRVDVGELHAQFNRALFNQTIAENTRLQAQVERLTNAGDELERVLTSKMSSYEAGNASFQWRAAKEGKQP
jgi:hypothetical protein